MRENADQKNLGYGHILGSITYKYYLNKSFPEGTEAVCNANPLLGTETREEKNFAQQIAKTI